jgi:hypothetical protein
MAMAPGVTLKTPQGVKVGASHSLDPQHMSTSDWNAYVTASSAAAVKADPNEQTLRGATLKRQSTEAPVDAAAVAAASAKAVPVAVDGPAGVADKPTLEEVSCSEDRQQPGLRGAQLRRATGNVPQWVEAGKLKAPVVADPDRQLSIDPGVLLAAATGWGSPNIGNYEPPSAKNACKPSMRQVKATGMI